jgi:glycosyltransferase involved in cell wall biosynthesis
MRAPAVCCICLTADRQRLTDRAVACFASQTYDRSGSGTHLLIYDTGVTPYRLNEVSNVYPFVAVVRDRFANESRRIAALRNAAIELTAADIIVTWDSDDWSAPERLVTQVANLKDQVATGYHNLLFLDTRPAEPGFRRTGDAWEYDYKRFLGARPGQALGSSLAFWRSEWERKAYDESKVYDDPAFCREHKVATFNGVGLPGLPTDLPGPMLIAEVHGQNSSASYTVFDNYKPHVNPEWRRAREWDDYCRGKLYP